MMGLKSRRWGRFLITSEMIEQEPSRSGLEKLFGKMIIFRAQFNYSIRAIEYEAISDLFEETDDYCIPPEYEIHVTKKDGQFTFTAKRVLFSKPLDVPFRKKIRQLCKAIKAFFERNK